MKLLSSIILSILAIWCFSIQAAKTPEQLMAEFSDILPADKKARCAWMKGGYIRGDWSGPGSEIPENWDKTIMVVESDNGVIRELTPANLFQGGKRSCENPSITYDGSRVIFSETYSDLKYVINWDGTELKEIAGVEGYLSRYWHNYENNTDWITVESGGIWRVNIDDPTDRVLLWSGECSRPWYSLSRDGTHMALNSPHPSFSIVEVPNGAKHDMPGEGCFINISPDDNYYCMPQNGTHSVHRAYNINGNEMFAVTTSETILEGWPSNPKYVSVNLCKNDEMEYECTRWVQPDYLTFFFYTTNVNPFIECISTGRFMYMHDAEELGACGSAGNMDMVLIDPSIPSGVNKLIKAALPAIAGGSYEYYSLDGRLVGKSAANKISANGTAFFKGIAVARNNDGVCSGALKRVIIGK